MATSYNPDPAANLELGYDTSAGVGDYMDFGGGEVGYNPTYDYGLSSLMGQLTGSGFTDALKSLGGLFTGDTGGKLGQLAAFGGLATLLSRMGQTSQAPVGYQGGIPKFTYERTQTAPEMQRPTTMNAAGQTVPYRPGQGGISYFTPGKFVPYTPPATEGQDTASGGSGSDTVVGVAGGGYMPSGIAMLAGGRYLRGPGDGVSDSIPAKFERSGQPARLADGEFVIDARTVSEIGNGSSEAGARKLYAMMDRVHKARKTAKRGEPSKADKYLPK